MNLFEPLLLPETVLWAWRKVRRSYRSADYLYDQAAVAAFELNLEEELASIRRDFEAARWSMQPLRLLPQPKKPGKDGTPRLRQYFEIAVRDQVAWAAIATVLGPELDRLMPAWSYGNRLYRAAWYETESPEGRGSRLNIGPYRHAAGHLYRHFKHSWPLFRRHISLTARTMASGEVKADELDEGDRRALQQSDGLPYVNVGFWRAPSADTELLYAASFDLSKFYPSVSTGAILRGFANHVEGFSENAQLVGLISQMLQFTVDDSGLTQEMLSAVEPLAPAGAFDGIPTGLFVGGFLANVAMLSLDIEVDRLLAERRTVAHFRFVDDHEVVAYDFEDLVSWIDQYRDLLKRFAVGPSIEPEKYTPSDLKYLLHPELREEAKSQESTEDLIARLTGETEVNGRKPTQLMTRTLAQVSLIAGTDFDLLTDAGRTQRLEQLEWLLLANIPEQEIRGDTRMAFAAARIATLTPALFRPDEELLMANRHLAGLLEKQRKKAKLGAADEQAIVTLRALIKRKGEEENAEWNSLVKRHFALLYEAFLTHPDKARLFIRLLDYCRVTGHKGLDQLAGWMKRQQAGDQRLLSCYLGALGLHSLSRHVLTASVAINSADILHRERAAAKEYLWHVAGAELDAFVPLPRSAPIQRFQADAKSAFVAALIVGSLEAERADLKLAKALRKRARDALEAPPTLANLRKVTGVPTGVWTHWFFEMTGAYRFDAPTFWPTLAEAHTPDLNTDWASLRRYPAAFPDSGWEELRRRPARLVADDAGWLQDARRQMGPIVAPSDSTNPPALLIDEKPGSPDTITLREWTEFATTLVPSDPRRSEWTALEIVRQIVGSLTDFDGPDMDILDHLHPDNVRIPSKWRDLDPEILVNHRITWEGWRSVTKLGGVSVTVPGIADFRYSELMLRQKREWERRLRPIGQIMWGILRLSFKLPAAWNIRGQERGLVQAVAYDLERLPISSYTLSLLQSCLLPRPFETSLLSRFPSLFGNLHRTADDDTEFDRPIRSPTEMCELIVQAQAALRDSQMTVLEHEPRQLIPVRLRQVGSFAEAEEGPGEGPA